MLKRIFFIVAFIFLNACANLNQKIHNLPMKVGRSKVLKTLGRPVKIERRGGHDHWVYKFVIDGRHYTRTVIMREGLLYKKGQLKPYSLKSF